MKCSGQTVLWELWAALCLCTVLVLPPGSPWLHEPALLYPGLWLAVVVPAAWAAWWMAEEDTDREIGAIVNIGSDIIDVAIFNKGIIIKSDIINLGSKNIDKDISYVYGVGLDVAKDLKDNFSVCSRKYADSNDVIDINLTQTETIKINQYELSEVVEARVTELLKLAKKSINNLTNRKISYIIVTGSITELTGFSYVVENILGINSSTLNITTLGIRNNKYSSAIGSIKYYYDKLKLRDINLTMFTEEKLDNLMNNKKNMLTANNDTFVSKIFDYFTGN